VFKFVIQGKRAYRKHNIPYRQQHKTKTYVKKEIVQAAFAAVTTAFLVLTATGIWFRGQGMALTWPWGV